MSDSDELDEFLMQVQAIADEAEWDDSDLVRIFASYVVADGFTKSFLIDLRKHLDRTE